MKRPPLKQIVWEDAFNGDHDWFKLDELPEEVEAILVTTVGFEVRRSRAHVTLAMSWQDSRDQPELCDLFTIPIGMIRSERTLR